MLSQASAGSQPNWPNLVEEDSVSGVGSRRVRKILEARLGTDSTQERRLVGVTPCAYQPSLCSLLRASLSWQPRLAKVPEKRLLADRHAWPAFPPKHQPMQQMASFKPERTLIASSASQLQH